MNINQCQRLAKETDPLRIPFRLIGPLTALDCEWVDPWLGLFKVKGHGIMRVSDFEMSPDISAELGHVVGATGDPKSLRGELDNITGKE